MEMELRVTLSSLLTLSQRPQPRVIIKELTSSYPNFGWKSLPPTYMINCKCSVRSHQQLGCSGGHVEVLVQLSTRCQRPFYLQECQTSWHTRLSGQLPIFNVSIVIVSKIWENDALAWNPSSLETKSWILINKLSVSTYNVFTSHEAAGQGEV